MTDSALRLLLCVVRRALSRPLPSSAPTASPCVDALDALSVQQADLLFAAFVASHNSRAHDQPLFGNVQTRVRDTDTETATRAQCAAAPSAPRAPPSHCPRSAADSGVRRWLCCVAVQRRTRRGVAASLRPGRGRVLPPRLQAPKAFTVERLLAVARHIGEGREDAALPAERRTPHAGDVILYAQVSRVIRPRSSHARRGTDRRLYSGSVQFLSLMPLQLVECVSGGGGGGSELELGSSVYRCTLTLPEATALAQRRSFDLLGFLHQGPQ